MFNNMNMKRLMELAGMEAPTPPGMDSPEGDEDMKMVSPGEGSDDDSDETENHLEKEEDVFQNAHDCLEKLVDFLHSQEGFEEKRGKSGEYADMEKCASELLDVMKQHLEGYGDEQGEGEPAPMGDEGEPDSDEGLHGEMPAGGSSLPKLPEGWAYIAGIGPKK